MHSLTRDEDTLICVLYKTYCDRRKDGLPLNRAAFFGDDDQIQRDLMPKWCIDDITDICWDLESSGFLDVMPGDNKANQVRLNRNGIRYMESRFPDGISSVLETLGKLATLVSPWL